MIRLTLRTPIEPWQIEKLQGPFLCGMYEIHLESIDEVIEWANKHAGYYITFTHWEEAETFHHGFMTNFWSVTESPPDYAGHGC